MFYAMRVATELGMQWRPITAAPEEKWCYAPLRSSVSFPRIRRSTTIQVAEIPRNFESALRYFDSFERGGQIRVCGPILGDFFFGACQEDPKNYFPNVPDTNPRERRLIAVHLRGTDFFNWNPDAVLPIDYYRTAIEVARQMVGSKAEVALVTDDLSMSSVVALESDLELNKNQHRRGLEEDFSLLRGADVIVSSPSTFCIWAGILGNAKVIHSLEWVRRRAELQDGFWLDLFSGGNKYYHASALV